jgi:hypothetical protein
MNEAPSTAVLEINRLHAETVRLAADSQRALGAAVVAAWRAGRLLQAERKQVERRAGLGSWHPWLRKNFRGTIRTAQRYVRLAALVPVETALQGLSIRQAYLRLGIATEPKSRAASPRVAALPPYIRLAGQLLRELRRARRRQADPALTEVLRHDLAGLYAQLRPLFEPANQSQNPFSKEACPAGSKIPRIVACAA